MHTCKFCFTSFSKEQQLIKHKEGKKYCLEYKDVIFICLKCNYTTKGIKNIDIHKNTCIANDNFEKMYFKTEPKNTEDIVKEIDNKVELLENRIKLLEQQLLIEKIKNKIYGEIIEQKLNIKLGDIYDEKEDSLHIYEIEKKGEITIHLHDYLKSKNFQNVVSHKTEEKAKNSVPISNIIEEQPKPKKQHYRPIKIDESKEIFRTPGRQDENILINRTPAIYAEKSPFIFYEDDEDDSIEIDVSKINAKIEDCFKSLKTSRTYNKILQNIKKYRNELLSVLPIESYIELIDIHNKNIKEIFEAKEPKKLTSIIASSMSAIDMRLIFFTDYDKYQLETDDIHRLKKSLVLSANFSDEYKVFDFKKLYNNFYNYSSALFDIKENLTRFIINKNGFNNIIYVPLPKSADTNPYSFYTLEKITKRHREWNMDCRLETFSNSFIHNIRPFIIQTFRKIYFDVFHDNTYRSEYNIKSQILECDCEQLIRNIMILLDPILFSKIIRNIVKENSIYYPTDTDKFNLRHDDSIQRKKFENYKPDENENLQVIKTIFDDISTEDALDFYRKKYFI
jgi:hypothetical protein